MQRVIIGVLAAFILCIAVCAQNILEPHKYMRAGTIEHAANTATVKVDFARPLEQAFIAIGEEYGWPIDYEDPPYQSSFDLTNAVTPAWHAAHPDSPQVVLAPSGGAFQSTFPEPSDIWSNASGEEQVLKKVVSDYNRSGNPGNFVVRRLVDGTVDVIGVGLHDDKGKVVSVQSILDTPITVRAVRRTGDGTFNAIFSSLTAKTGVQFSVGWGPANLLGGGRLVIGGTNVPARDLIRRAVDALGPYDFFLIYEPQERNYMLGISLVVRSEYDAWGVKHMVPVWRSPTSH